MIPTEGRIVRFVDTNVEHPAMIHRVHNDTCVNLTVFSDAGPQVKTSVVLDAGTAPATGPCEYRPYTWHWPKIGPRE